MSDRVESSLAVDYTILKGRVGRILAVPEDESKWTAQQRRAVDSVVEDGLRQYYQPPAVDQFGPHTWSFMFPTRELQTFEGQRWYDLPFDFSHLNGASSVTFSDSSQRYVSVDITSESRMRELENAEGESTGVPRVVAVRMKESRGAAPQEWEIGFHPTPDATHKFAFNYYAAPYMVTDERPYPLGGMAHSQGILLSCLAAAEQYEFEQRGEHYAAFIEQLKADIAHDARRGPTTLGYGGVTRRGGRIDRYGVGRNSPWLASGNVTYGGVDYGS